MVQAQGVRDIEDPDVFGIVALGIANILARSRGGVITLRTASVLRSAGITDAPRGLKWRVGNILRAALKQLGCTELGDKYVCPKSVFPRTPEEIRELLWSASAVSIS